MHHFYCVGSSRFARLLFGGIIGLMFLSAPAESRAGSIAYTITGSSYSGAYFGTTDLSSGNFTPIGALAINADDGLGVYKGGLYTGLFGGNVLYRVDPSTGQTTVVGAGLNNYYLIGSTTAGLFGVSNIGQLFSIDAATGAQSDIGMPQNYNFTGNYVGISNGSSSLYITTGVSGSSATLETVDLSGGSPSVVRQLGTEGVASIQVGAMVYENGTLYGGEDSPNNEILSPLDSNSASPIAFNDNGYGIIVGLAQDVPSTATPLPSESLASLALLAGAGVLKLGQRRRRQTAL